MTLELPDMPSISIEDLRLELACALYASRRVARGMAAKVAGVDDDTFERALQQRGVTNGYSADDVTCDLSALNELLSR
jgi:predicted HTH domain antitoxin